jgi:hypothetical protein
MDEAEERGRDEAYRAIGRYVAEFSGLVACMRSLLTERLHKPEDDTTLVELALGEGTAIQIANSFFAVCQEAAHLEGTEKKIGRSLRARVLKEIEQRNNIAHGDWYVEPEPLGPSTLIRVKPASGDEPFVVQDVPITDLDGWADAVHDLSLMVMEFGDLALGTELGNHRSEARVRDFFAIEKQRVVWVRPAGCEGSKRAPPAPRALDPRLLAMRPDCSFRYLGLPSHTSPKFLSRFSPKRGSRLVLG